MGVLLKGFRLHCAVMIMLYICQGLAQGTLQIMILLLLQSHPELSAADQATLALPMYAFSLKFLWAPVVDRYYRHCGCRARRGQSCTQRSPPCAGYHCLDESPTKKSASRCCPSESAASAVPPAATRTGVSASSESLFHRLHRRVQWVVLLELVMGGTFLWLSWVGDGAYLEAIVKHRSVFWRFFFILCTLSFANATQDVAVDAWAVEGLDPCHVSTAGMLQLVGVTIGVSLANIFVPLHSRFPEYFSLYRFFAMCASLCGICALLAIMLAWCRRLFNEHRLELRAAELRRKSEVAETATPTTPTQQTFELAEASEAVKQLYIADETGQQDEPEDVSDHVGIIRTVRQIFATEGLRELVTVYLTRGWPLAVFPLVMSRLISMGVVSAGAIARYRIYSTAAQVIIAAYASVPLLRYVRAPRVVQYISGFDFLLNVVAVACFVGVAVPAAASWFGLTVVLPLTVLLFGVGALGFVANVSLQGRFAHLFPRDVGGVLSLLAAISNMGHHLPGTFCLYAASLIVEFCTWYTGQDTRYSTYYATGHETPISGVSDFASAPPSAASSSSERSDPRVASYWVKMDVISCSLFFFAVGLLLRYVFLVPASDRLTSIVEEVDGALGRPRPEEDPSQPLLHI